MKAKRTQFDRSSAIAEILHELEMYVDASRAGDASGDRCIASLFDAIGFRCTNTRVTNEHVYVAIEAVLPLQSDDRLQFLRGYVLEVRDTHKRWAA